MMSVVNFPRRQSSSDILNPLTYHVLHVIHIIVTLIIFSLPGDRSIARSSIVQVLE